jgi:hypothetical protein
MQNALKIRPDGRGSIIAEAISYNNARDRWVVHGGSMLNSGNRAGDNRDGGSITSSSFSTGDIVPVIGSLYNNSNVVYSNQDGVSITSSSFSSASSLDIAGNVLECVALFSARKLTKVTWVNDSDVYSKPDIEHPDYKQWNYDCLVNAVISNSSLQSSMRDVNYKEKKWDIINQWFPFDIDWMYNLAIKHNNQAIIDSIKDYPCQRFMFKALSSVPLSDDALGVLAAYKASIEQNFEHLEKWHLQHGYLNVWDFGWYQYRMPLKQELPKQYDALMKVIKPFQARLAEGIYKFKFFREYECKVVVKKGMRCDSIF